MKSKYAKEYSNLKKKEYYSLKSDEMSFRVHDPSILESDANYGLKMKTELADWLQVKLCDIWTIPWPGKYYF